MKDRIVGGVLRSMQRFLGSRFHAVRMDPAGFELLRTLDDGSEPLLIVLNHPSWWDPLLCLFLRRWLPSRSHCGLMDGDQLSKFPFFRWLGAIAAPSNAFGLFKELQARFQYPRPTLWLTPQGRFADAREAVRARPGVRTLQARFPSLRTVALAVEYGFWEDSRPEIFLRMVAVQDLRKLSEEMTENSRSLSELVRSRDPQRFATLLGLPARTLPWLDLWLRLRGRSSALGAI